MDAFYLTLYGGEPVLYDLDLRHNDAFENLLDGLSSRDSHWVFYSMAVGLPAIGIPLLALIGPKK